MKQELQTTTKRLNYTSMGGIESAFAVSEICKNSNLVLQLSKNFGHEFIVEGNRTCNMGVISSRFSNSREDFHRNLLENERVVEDNHSNC